MLTSCSGSLAPGAPSISGTSLADILFHGIHGDILLILDTCYASVSACSLGPEVLAAAGWLDEAAANLDTSFTRALIEELKLLNGHPTTVAQLYSSIHRKGAEYNLLCNPVQIPQIGKSSIVLKKMTGPTQRKPESHEARMRKIDALEQSESRVLISVHLQDDIRLPDVEEWKRWLTINVPSRVLSSDISIEAAFKTKSSLLLMAIPFEVWTMLKADNEAYKFVSFVDSTASIPRTTLVLGKTAPAVKSVPASSSGLASGSVLATIQLGQRSRPKPDENTPPPGYTVRTELPLRKHGI